MRTRELPRKEIDFCRNGKPSFTKRVAQTALNKRLKSRHGHPDHLRIYHCDDCNGWHLTSSRDRSE